MAQLAANSLEGKAEGFRDRIESVLREIDHAKGVYMAEAKERREDIRSIYAESKDAGVNVKALRGLIKSREMQRKIDAIPDGFDEEEAAEFEHLVEALGDLGRAAAKAKGYAKDDDDKDLRPNVLKQAEKERADEAALGGVGKGAEAKAAAVDSLAAKH